MSSAPLSRISPEQYLEAERASEQKHEYWYGEVFAMAGGSPAHSLVINNLQFRLTGLLIGKPCFVFNADVRVAVASHELITYPDATVLCGHAQYVDEGRDTLTNPTMVVEVLPPSTAKSDRGDKAFHYRRVPSMLEILLVDPAPVMIEHYWKLLNGHWELEMVTDPAAVLHFPHLDIELPVADIYRNVELL
jgi:Uma2 family endonuclease